MANVNVVPGLGKFPFEGGASGLVMRMIDHDGPALYAAGGEPITAAALGFKRIAFVIAMASLSGTYYIFPYIGIKKMGTSFKLLWMVTATAAEAAAIDLSAQSCKLIVIGLP